jgi:biopolymer transport protein ExbD
MDVANWLRVTWQDLPNDPSGKKVEKRVRIRADRDVEYQDVHQVAEVCRRNKFTSLYYGVMLPTAR